MTASAPCLGSLGFSDSVALQDFLRLARQSVMGEVAAIKDQIEALTTDSATVTACMAAVTSAALPSAPQPPMSSLPDSTAPSNGRKRRRQDTEACPQLHSPTDSGARRTTENCLPQSQPEADVIASNRDCSSRTGSPELTSVALKSQRISEALSAVDAAYFRARTSSAATGSLNVVSAPLLPPTNTHAQASSPCNTQHQDVAAGLGLKSRASQLPGYLKDFGQNLDAFSRFGSLRWATCASDSNPILVDICIFFRSKCQAVAVGGYRVAQLQFPTSIKFVVWCLVKCVCFVSHRGVLYTTLDPTVINHKLGFGKSMLVLLLYVFCSPGSWPI